MWNNSLDISIYIGFVFFSQSGEKYIQVQNVSNK